MRTSRFAAVRLFPLLTRRVPIVSAGFPLVPRNLQKRIMSTTASDKFSRLPEVAKPSLYTINLKPNLETFKCEGHEVITLDVSLFLYKNA